MQRITEIRLRNFRAFGEREEVIELPKGENLLIYGENGSGKSSLYAALRDLLESSVDSKLKYVTNSFLPNKEPGFLHLTLAENPHSSSSIGTTYTFSSDPALSTTLGVSELELAQKQQGFLTYKEIVGSYLTNLQTIKPNLYPFIVDRLLSHHLLPNSGQPVGLTWEAIAKGLKDGPPDVRQNLWAVDIPQFTQNLRELLRRVGLTTRKWLSDYFGPTVELDDAQIIIVRRGNSLIEHYRRLEVDIRFHAQAVTSYQDTLNEARLSALAVCLYLAALKEYPDDLKFKPLVLDDIFVGLDTNNRLPLLRLLHEEFVLQGYQVILTTYDREWFELAGNWFKHKGGPYSWRQLEMFEEEVEAKNGVAPLCPFRPVLVPNSGNYEKAVAYFRAKDYPAAGNYLRKELEEVTKKLAPFESGDAAADARDKGNSIEARLDRLRLLREECGMPLGAKIIEDILLYKQLILNPSSHYNTTHTIYREELKSTFQLVEELRVEKVVRIVRLLGANEKLRYENSDAATYGNYWAECELLKDLRIVLEDGEFVKSMPCPSRTVRWEWNNVPFAKDMLGELFPPEKIAEMCAKERELKDRPGVIKHTLSPHVESVDLLRDFKHSGQSSLLNLLEYRQAGFPQSVQEA